ncbi:peptidase inhibitor family I36 protein [Actinomadura chibensis]|uniref:Peptidase inhibitor family I36 protein n=1 Tax=Actinomadura chibensis TaxID=392828 RepID=A0A5D0N6X4_9ACTN|nr:peptidase inhibitor family I36 protein [Actinomadura chibensis]TYB40130.1 hypothetical protein FXF69_39770 [Actinomadura chibensis]
MSRLTAPHGVARITTALASVLAVPASAAVFAVPASAAAHPEATTFTGSNCPANSLCMYRDFNYRGGGVALTRGKGARDFRHPDLNFNDQMSSWSNDSGVLCYWYEHDDYRSEPGQDHPMKNGYRVNLTSSENDTASSARCFNNN